MKVMSFNLRFASADDGTNSWPYRKEFVIQVLQRHAPAIVGVQEAQKVQVDYLAKELPSYRYIGVGRDNGLDDGEYSAIFYDRTRCTCVRQETFWLSEMPEKVGSKGWDANNVRICTWGEFQTAETDGSIFIFNTHLDHIGQEAQVEGAKLVVKRIETAAGKRPAILTGDFNCTPHMQAYDILTGGDATLQDIRMADARAISETPPSGPAWTFHGFNPPGQIIIDYIFVRNIFGVESFQTLEDNWNGRYPSDHLPVMADIHLGET